MSRSGSHHVAAAEAAAAALGAGCTATTARIMAAIASRGRRSWLTDSALARELRCHRVTVCVGRADLRRRGLLECTRLYSGQRAPDVAGAPRMRYATSHGCVVSVPRWGRIRRAAPITRAEYARIEAGRRRERRDEARANAAAYGRPRHSAPIPSAPPSSAPPVVDVGEAIERTRRDGAGELAAAMQRAYQAASSRWTSRGPPE